jgi:hypothetical protein
VKRQYLALDIETAAEVPDGVSWVDYRPLGITCIATQIEGEQPQVWHSWHNEAPAPRMLAADIQRVVAYLQHKADEGLTLLSWNGLKFDFDIIAEESRLNVECEALAANHVDMMFHAFCELGYFLSLNAASRGMGLPGKVGPIVGAMAPTLWREGRFDEVKRYVARDVDLTLSLARKCEEHGHLSWTSKRGKPMRFALRSGWLTTRDAMRLPVPDTSWMDMPTPRAHFVQWMKHQVIA